METLSQYNKRVGDAGVACDKCGAGMNYDTHAEQMERTGTSVWPGNSRSGRPVKCSKCDFTGRRENGF